MVYANALTEMRPLQSRYVLGMRVDATSYDDATGRILRWARAGESRYVCLGSVHMVMESYDSSEFGAAVNGADLVTTDGMPLVWSLLLLGIAGATRVYGAELTARVLEAAAREHVPVGFYGSSSQCLDRLLQSVRVRFPGIEVAYAFAPPFRPLHADEQRQALDEIRASGARIIFVGLGCPKQERWMFAQRGKLPAVMLGVGAAFDFLAGTKAVAPSWMQAAGLEWLFRLLSEPRRLWRRYLKHNPRFLAFFARQLLAQRMPI